VNSLGLQNRDVVSARDLASGGSYAVVSLTSASQWAFGVPDLADYEAPEEVARLHQRVVGSRGAWRAGFGRSVALLSGVSM
jgi:hypothetical protein